jgi:hypothetical protein
MTTIGQPEDIGGQIGTTVRQTIIDAVDYRLKTILTANGYNTDIGENARPWIDEPAEQAELPRVEYRDTDVDINIENEPDNVHTCKLAITGEVIMSGATAIEEARKAETDLLQAIYIEAGPESGRWGGVALKTDPPKTKVIIKQTAEKNVAIDFSFDITYRTLTWDPFTAV